MQGNSFALQKPGRGIAAEGCHAWQPGGARCDWRSRIKKGRSRDERPKSREETPKVGYGTSDGPDMPLLGIWACSWCSATAATGSWLHFSTHVAELATDALLESTATCCSATAWLPKLYRRMMSASPLKYQRIEML